jgi:hypothetical protein
MRNKSRLHIFLRSFRKIFGVLIIFLLVVSSFGSASIQRNPNIEKLELMQFTAGGHVMGFQPKRVYFVSLNHALSVEFWGTSGGGLRRRGLVLAKERCP